MSDKEQGDMPQQEIDEEALAVDAEAPAVDEVATNIDRIILKISSWRALLFLAGVCIMLVFVRDNATPRYDDAIIISLALPKSGTTSMYQAFLSAGLDHTVHWWTNGPWIRERWAVEGRNWTLSVGDLPQSQKPSYDRKHDYIGRIIESNIATGQPPFGGLLRGVHAVAEMNYDYWECSDRGETQAHTYYPQTDKEFLLNITEMYPNAKFVLSLRDARKWALSVNSWFNLRELFWLSTNLHVGWEISDLEKFYQDHAQLVQDTIPSHRLLVFRIEEEPESLERKLRTFLKLPKLTWGQSNKNPRRGKDPARQPFVKACGNRKVGDI